MAPAYALLISLVLGLILGFLLLDDRMRIRFTSGTEDKSQEWQKLSVLVKTAGSEHPADEQPDGSKEITVVNPQDDIAICLPKGWVVDDKAGYTANPPVPDHPKLSCWNKTQVKDKAQVKDVEITLRKAG